MPAFGSPTNPTSAMRRSSRRIVRRSPGSPFCACFGARWVAVAKWTLPRPPRPPRATITRWPVATRSPISSPDSSSWSAVPGGTASSRSAPARPCRREPSPRPPDVARNCRRCWKSRRVVRPGSTDRYTEPPRPPSPPSGPPRGTCASRRKVAAPSPPSPARTRTMTRSRNMRRLSHAPRIGLPVSPAAGIAKPTGTPAG